MLVNTHERTDLQRPVLAGPSSNRPEFYKGDKHKHENAYHFRQSLLAAVLYYCLMLDFSPDGRYVVISSNGAVCLWDLQTVIGAATEIAR